MKGSVKFIATAIAICLTIGVLMVGIFAATGGSMEVQSLIGWQSIGVEMDINGRVSGNKSSDNIASTYSDSLTIQHDNKVSAWQIGSINFDIKDDLAQNKRYSEPVVIRFGVTNTSTNNVNIYYYFSSAPTTIPNVKYEYQLAYGVLSSGETWQTDFFSGSYSGNMSVSGTSDKYYSLHKDTEYNFVAPGESVVFEMRFTVINFTQSISTASSPLEANLVFQNSPREGGTMYNPYIIANAEDFNMYASNGGFANSNNYFLQTSDISFNSTQTAQAVSAPKANAVSEDSALVVTDFLAHYDGGNKQIDLSGTNSPLFNAVGSDSNSTASLENLNIYNSNSTASAGVVKNLYGRLNNISFDGSITWSSGGSIGGIAEKIYDGCSIIGCINFGDLLCTDQETSVYMGGIFGNTGAIVNAITIKNCGNEGNLSSFYGHIGGVGGYVCYDFNESGTNPVNINFVNCYNMGQLSITNTSPAGWAAGGILGLSWCCSFTNCFNTATISVNSGNYSGGLVGVDDTMMSTATTCYDIGENSGLGIGGTVTNCYWLGGSGTGSKTLTQLQNRNTYSGFTFDASNWVWANSIIKINGKEKAMQLPRLAFEELEYALDRSSLYVLNGTTSGDYTYYGAYPQTYVGDTLNTTLESALSAGTLKRTGWSYTTDINGTMTTLPEYLYDGNYYAYLASAGKYGSSSYTFSTGETVTGDSEYFFKVEPLKWVKKSDTYICSNVIGSIAFNSSTTTNRLWSESEVRAWLNEVFYFDSGIELVKQEKSTVENNSESNIADGSGTSTNDFVWIPSHEELSSWYSDNDSRKANNSDMARATYGYYSSSYTSTMYWTRSMNPSGTTGMYYVVHTGSLTDYKPTESFYGVRPCFILDEGSGNNSTGTGTASDPYIIASDEDFIKYSTPAYFGNSSLYFKQVSDISYNGSVQTDLIAGYDGNGKTIDITGTTRPLWNNVGVEFSNAYKDKIRLRNLKVVCNGTTATSAIANSFYTGKILNVSLSGSFTASKWYGLIMYMGDYASLSYCVNNANIVADWQPTTTTATSEVNAVTLAGIVGSQANDGFTNISYCGNNGNLTGYNVSGVIGEYCIYGGASILGCFNTGNITSNGQWASGIAGSLYLGSLNGKFEECYNTGSISGTNIYSLVYQIGDGAGETTTNITIKNCYDTAASHMVRILSGNLIFESTWCIGGAIDATNASNTSIDTGGLKGTSPYSHSQSDFTSYGFSFGTYGVANSGWVWRTADLKVNGIVNGTYSLPRLWYEDLTMEAIMELLGANYNGSMEFNVCACAGCEYYNSALSNWEWCSNCSKNTLCDFCGACSGHGCSHLGGGTASAVPQIYIDGVEQEDVAIAGATTIGDYLQALDGKNYPGYFYDEDLTMPAGYNDVITDGVKLYTKSATLTNLNFTSNGDGTCIVDSITDFDDYKSELSGDIILPMKSPEGDIVEILGTNSFCYSSITSIVLPTLLKRINSGSFGYCSNLTRVTIPGSVEYMGSRIFFNCNNLSTVFIPISVITILLDTCNNSSLTIYCEAESQPSGWEDGWNNDNLVVWGVTREQYESQYA